METKIETLPVADKYQRSVSLTVTVPPYASTAIEKLAEQGSCTTGDVMRQAIFEFLTRQGIDTQVL